MKTFVTAFVLAVGLVAAPVEAEAAAPGFCFEGMTSTSIKVPATSQDAPGWDLFWGEFISPTVEISQTYNLTLTAEELEACAGQDFNDHNIAMWNHEPRNPDFVPEDPQKGWTCAEMLPEGVCWRWAGKTYGDVPFGYRNFMYLREQAPQRCVVNGWSVEKGTFAHTVTPGWRNEFQGWGDYYIEETGPAYCWLEVNTRFPDEFGPHTLMTDVVRFNASTPDDLEGKTLAITINIEEEEVDPEPIDPGEPGPIDIDYSNNEWGNVEVFQSRIQSVKIANLSGFSIPVRSIKIRYDDEDQWLKIGENRWCDTLRPPDLFGKPCKVDVQFFPRNVGPQGAVLEVELWDVDYELEIPLTGVGFTDPAAEGQRPPPPAAPRPPDTPNQEVDEVEPGSYVVVTRKNKVKIKFTPPGGAEAYEWRKKRTPGGSWSRWHVVDPEPNKKGFVVFEVPMKRFGCYKIQARAVSESGPSSKKTIVVCKEPRVLPGNG